MEQIMVKQENEDLNNKNVLLIIPLCYFSLTDGFIVLYNYNLIDSVKLNNIGVLKAIDGQIYVRFFDNQENYNFAFSVDLLINKLTESKLSSVKIAFYCFESINKPARFIYSIEIPQETIYEIKGIVNFIKLSGQKNLSTISS